MYMSTRADACASTTLTSWPWPPPNRADSIADVTAATAFSTQAGRCAFDDFI